MAAELDWEQIPRVDRNLFYKDTLRAVKELFEKPGVQEDYEIWLAEYRKTHPAAES